MGVALLVGWLAGMAPARAQAPVPEPIPCGPSTAGAGGPPLSPPYAGPLPAQAAPHGPPDCMVLPADIPGAFTDCPPEEVCGTYASLGYRGLERQRPQHGGVAFIDRLNPTNLDTGAVPLAQRFLGEVQDYHDVKPGMGSGITGTIGYLWGGNALELTGFYIFDRTDAVQDDRNGRLDLPFNKFPVPLGFEGDNGLWLQADRVRTSLRTEMGDAEFNYRWTSQAYTGAELILGFRYTDLRERLGIFTGDDDLTVLDINGNPDPKRQALYQVRTHNHLLTPQLGFEWRLPLCQYLDFACMGKGAWGVNYQEVRTILTRGDGFQGPDTAHFHTGFAQTYEAGFFLDLWLFERMRIRGGYNLLLLCDVANAEAQVNFDLTHQGTQGFHEGTIFYHGPTVEVQVLF
jgi:hypothetical protein